MFRVAGFLVFILLFSHSTLKSQSLEFGLQGGSIHYMGDLSDMKINLDLAKPTYGMFVRFNPDRYIALKGSFLYGMVGGADSLSSKPEHRLRNFSFRSQILDFSFQLEWNILGFCFAEADKNYGFSPYLFTGLTVFKFNPETYYKGKWYELQPLGTEGQGTTQYQDRKSYELSQLALPLGAGFKVRFNDNWNASMEVGFRTTFTDYIDDVSSNPYVEPELLRQKTGNDNPAAELSDRSGEVNMGNYITNNVDVVDIVPRGNPNTPVDFLLFGTVSLCYRFPLPGIKCTSF